MVSGQILFSSFSPEDEGQGVIPYSKKIGLTKTHWGGGPWVCILGGIPNSVSAFYFKCSCAMYSQTNVTKEWLTFQCFRYDIMQVSYEGDTRNFDDYPETDWRQVDTH